MGIFKKDPVKRLDEDELREIYLDLQGSEKRTSIFLMVMCGLASIGIISFSIIKEIYWILAFSVISIIIFIHLITKLSRVIEDIFENRFFEEEETEGGD